MAGAGLRTPGLRLKRAQALSRQGGAGSRTLAVSPGRGCRTRGAGARPWPRTAAARSAGPGRRPRLRRVRAFSPCSKGRISRARSLRGDAVALVADLDRHLRPRAALAMTITSPPSGEKVIAFCSRLVRMVRRPRASASDQAAGSGGLDTEGDAGGRPRRRERRRRPRRRRRAAPRGASVEVGGAALEPGDLHDLVHQLQQLSARCRG